MNRLSARTIILTGFALVLLGAVLPFLMVLEMLSSTFFLNFLAFTAAVSGLFLGLIGAATLVRGRK